MKIKFYKKDLLRILNENLYEMPMDFDTEDRPYQGVQDKLSQGDTPLKKIPFPKTGNEPNKNFQELLASERYRNVVAKVREYTGIQTPLRGQNVGSLTQMMMSAHNNIVRTESQHREALERLAVELVMKEMGIPVRLP